MKIPLHIPFPYKLSSNKINSFIFFTIIFICFLNSISAQVIPQDSRLDLQYCEGEDILFGIGDINGNPFTDESYSWSYDNGISIVNLTTTSNNIYIANASLSASGTYQVTSKKTATEEIIAITNFFVEVHPPFNLSPFDVITFYDTNNDGLHTINFNKDITPFILDGLDPSLFTIEYFLTPISNFGTSQTNKLNNTYTTTEAYDTFKTYAKVYYNNSPDKCFNILEFDIIVQEVPQPSQPTDYFLCDDNINGNDTDGYSNTFILNTKDSEILKNLPANEYILSYHTSLTGAETSALTDVINKTIPYKNIIMDEQNIYIRLEHIEKGYVFISDESSSNLTPLKLIVNPLPIINPITELTQCDIDSDLSSLVNLTLAEINISNEPNITFEYYPTETDAIANTAKINNKTTYQASDGDIIWVKVFSSENCSRISQLNISIYKDNNNIGYNNIFEECDDLPDEQNEDAIYDGIASFNINSAIVEIKNNFPDILQNNLDVLFFENEDDRDTVTNFISDTGNYRNTNIPAFTMQNIYFKVINITNNECNGIGNFSILVNQRPTFDVLSPQVICSNITNSITIVTENPDDTYSYNWTKNNDTTIISGDTFLTTSSEGEYHVTAINNNTLCEHTKTITVIESNIATINESDISIIDDSTNNSITINEVNLGNGDYEYALLNEDQTDIIRDYQDDPFFENLEGGIYTIFIQDKNNCGTITHPISIIDFPDFFTPNGDSYNDTWSVKGVNTLFYQSKISYIFDRFGKKVAEFSIDNAGWDGTFSGKKLPQNDYWYSVQLVDTNGNIRNKKGHFSLIR